MKQQQLPPSLSMGGMGVLAAMPDLANVVQVTSVLRCITDIKHERDAAVLFESPPKWFFYLLPPAFCLLQVK